MQNATNLPKTGSPIEIANMESDLPRLLTVDQFAAKMQISRAIVFVWMRKGILVSGKHFIKIGRVLRFLWSSELIKSINQISEKTAPAKPVFKPVQQTKKTSLNWNY